MRMKLVTRRAVLLVAALLLCVGSVGAQGPAEGPAPDAGEKGHATIFVYRRDVISIWSPLWFLHKNLPVYVGERTKEGKWLPKVKVASLKNKRYFLLRLPAGSYRFDTRGDSGHFGLDVEAGGEYFLRLDRGSDCPSEDPNYAWSDSNKCEGSNPHFEKMQGSDPDASRTKLKPVKPGDVKDRGRVIIPPAEPPNDAKRPDAKRQ